MQLEQICYHFQSFQSLVRESYLLTRTKKYQYFLFCMGFQKTEKHVQFLVDLDFHIVMK